MKMPSKKFAHIPVYTLGFESPQRAAAAKATVTQRRDAFQCVPLLFADTAGNAGARVRAGCPVCWETPQGNHTQGSGRALGVSGVRQKPCWVVRARDSEEEVLLVCTLRRTSISQTLRP